MAGICIDMGMMDGCVIAARAFIAAKFDCAAAAAARGLNSGPAAAAAAAA